MSQVRPHIVIVAGRGEVLRNFLFSETSSWLAEEADVTVLSVVDDESFLSRFRMYSTRIERLKEHRPPRIVSYLRTLIENAHDVWLWSAAGRNHWELRDRRARERGRIWPRRALKFLARLLAWRPALRLLTRVEQELHYRLRPTREFDRLFEEIQPDLVFNGSHIHGLAAELPCRVAQRMGIPTAGFLFSWDNLTTRSRIFVPYDDFLVWTENIRRDFLRIYPEVHPSRVHAVGTPQFDYHTKAEFELSRDELAHEIGFDPARPYVLYTTAMADHFPEEHVHVERVAHLLAEIDLEPRPQLVVRTYAKGTSEAMRELAARGLPETVFPTVRWNQRWLTPEYEDLAIYSSLLRHCALGINAASTVSLELMLFDKPVINLRHDPPGTDLPWCLGYERHILFDHFRPVAESGATMVANSDDDMRHMLHRGLTAPEADSETRSRFLQEFFGDLYDDLVAGRAGERTARWLLEHARRKVG